MKKLDILYEDKYLIAVNKKTFQLTVRTNKKENNTLYQEVSDYVKKQHPKNKIFIVHRLDKETSGIVLFAKNESIKSKLQNNWHNVYREYKTVVEGKMPHKKEILKNYLYTDKYLNVKVSNNKNDELAITEYEVIKYNNKKSLLKVIIKTGKKNQIRAQLAYINNPIIGDSKYNKNKSKYMMLHANKLIFNHPVTKKDIVIEAKDPKYFMMV